MANLGMRFNANEVEPNAPMDVLPPGKYVAEIVRSDVKNTKNYEQDGSQFLELELVILAPEQLANRRVWDRINFANPNQQTVQIAQRTLSAISRAVGVMDWEDSELLHNIPMQITVIQTPDQRTKSLPSGHPDKLPNQNAIRGYEPVPGQGAAPQGFAGAGNGAGAAQNGGGMTGGAAGANGTGGFPGNNARPAGGGGGGNAGGSQAGGFPTSSGGFPFRR